MGHGHYKTGESLKIWADKYAFEAEVKGGTITIRPEKIFVTSNFRPSEIWKEDPQLLAAIEDRFQLVDARNWPRWRDNANKEAWDALEEEYQPPADPWKEQRLSS